VEKLRKSLKELRNEKERKMRDAMPNIPWGKFELKWFSNVNKQRKSLLAAEGKWGLSVISKCIRYLQNRFHGSLGCKGDSGGGWGVMT
jgi:hypothetical protein